MAAYRHLRAPDGTDVFVKDGFSWPAFFFGPLWALFKRAWRLALIMLIAGAVLVVLDGALARRAGHPVALLFMLGLYLAYMAVCGWLGNAWLKRTLERKGYTLESVNPDEQISPEEDASP